MLLPDKNRPGFVFFWVDDTTLRVRVAALMTDFGASRRFLDQDSVLCFHVHQSERVLLQLDTCFSLYERRHIRLMVCDSPSPNISQFANVRSLEQLTNSLSGRWIAELVAEKRYRSLMQPIVSATDYRQVLGYEFLFRGMKEDGTDVPPPILFDTAMRADVAYMLDMAAGESAIETAIDLSIDGDLFINILPDTLARPEGLDAWLTTVVEDRGVDTERIVFELVESQQMADPELLKTLAAWLRSAGARLALDDFGSGFNNLVMLTDVRPDFIKLDKSLVQHLTHDPQKWNMVANIVDSAKQAGVRVIAEGVEDKVTASALRDTGVEYLQGYYLGYPAERPVGLRARQSVSMA